MYTAPSPSLGVILTINNHSFAIGGSWDATLNTITNPASITANARAADANDTTIYNYITDPTDSIPVALNVPYAYSGDISQGGFSVYLGPSLGESFGLIPSSIFVTVNGISPTVPEPATWALLLVGFAGLGFVAYRRRKLPSVVAAR